MVLFFAAVSASLDAYFAGLAYNTLRKMSFLQVLYAGSFTFFACVIAMTVAEVVLRAERLIAVLGGIILMLLGIKNVLSKRREEVKSRKNELGGVTLLGLSISADAACVCITLTGEGVLACSLLMCAFHTFFLGLSRITVRLSSLFDRLTTLSGLYLIIMGMTKILVK